MGRNQFFNHILAGGQQCKQQGLPHGKPQRRRQNCLYLKPKFTFWGFVILFLC
uniref:Uncharacterized protein n=1 Tax=Anguilla anguilla TaxID=7936 RepID=A0A0E9W802_ANGAN